MKLISSSVEWWQQQNLSQHIARVGRVCYKSKGKQPDENMSAEEAEAFIQKRDEEPAKAFGKADTARCTDMAQDTSLCPTRKDFQTTSGHT